MRVGRATVGAWRRKRELAFLDRRRDEARFMSELRQDLVADLGGNPSAARRLLIDCACFAALRISRLTTPWLGRGEDLNPSQLAELVTWQGELRATLKVLGIERVEAAPPALAELLTPAAQEGGSVTAPSPLDFFSHLRWLDGRPLLDTIEPYRRQLFLDALYTFDEDGRPEYNMVLCGRAKKNWKSTDLILAAFYRFLVWPSSAGNDCFLLANDEGQAADDLTLAKKLIAANPVLKREVIVKLKEIVRKDGQRHAGDPARPGRHGRAREDVPLRRLRRDPRLPRLVAVRGAGAGPDAARRADVDRELRHDLVARRACPSSI